MTVDRYGVEHKIRHARIPIFLGFSGTETGMAIQKSGKFREFPFPGLSTQNIEKA